MATIAVQADLWVLGQTAGAVARARIPQNDPPSARLWTAALARTAEHVGANRHDSGLLFGAHFVGISLPHARRTLETFLVGAPPTRAKPWTVLARPQGPGRCPGGLLDGAVVHEIRRARVVGPPGTAPVTADLAFLPLDACGAFRARELGFFPGMIDPPPPGDFRRPIRPDIAAHARLFLARPPAEPLIAFPHGPYQLRVDPVADPFLGAALVRARAGSIFRLGHEWFLLWIVP